MTKWTGASAKCTGVESSIHAGTVGGVQNLGRRHPQALLLWHAVMCCVLWPVR
jgi:hypothetical protein